MTFQCPACGATADVYVPQGGSLAGVRLTTRAAGVYVGADFANPENTDVYHGCTIDGPSGENTLMTKVRERDS
jgi:hypothetical protein